MKATESNFSFMQNEEIEIPFFQRPYVWGEEQWEQLFDDLVSAYYEKKEHFLGSIVLKQMQTRVGEGSRRSLIDGQQRVTTFSLLIKSLYESIDANHRIDYMTYLFRTPAVEKKPKIHHSKNDEKVFSEILASSGIKELEQYKNNKLVDAYRYFVKRIAEIENHLDFLKFILNSRLWVTINLDSNEDEQKIFDSINTAGIKLTATDIVKNAIFAKAVSLECNHIELYEKYWESIFEDDELRIFWEQEVVSGRIKRVQSEIFLHAFAITQGFFNPEKDSLEKLSDIYKNHFSNFDAIELENFIVKIYDYAKIYKNFPQIKKETIFSFDNHEVRLFHILQQTESNTVLPLVLYLKTQLSSHQDKLQKCFSLIEGFILCNWLCYKTTKDYNKLFAGVVRKLEESEDFYFTIFEILQERMPKHEEIKNALISKDYFLSNNRARLVLFWIELYRRFQNSKRQDIIELSYIYTLEHLIPEEWGEHWSDVCIDDEKASELIYQIGNMTLLKGSLNSSIKNQEWSVKLKGDGSRKNCISTCADLLITKEILNWDRLDEERIKQRTIDLVNDFFEVWNIKNPK